MPLTDFKTLTSATTSSAHPSSTRSPFRFIPTKNVSTVHGAHAGEEGPTEVALGGGGQMWLRRFTRVGVIEEGSAEVASRGEFE